MCGMGQGGWRIGCVWDGPGERRIGCAWAEGRGRSRILSGGGVILHKCFMRLNVFNQVNLQ